MVDAWIELTDVNFQAVKRSAVKPTDISLCLPCASVYASMLDAGIGVISEGLDPYRFQHVHYGVMHDSIRVIRQTHYHPLLRLIDLERCIL